MLCMLMHLCAVHHHHSGDHHLLSLFCVILFTGVNGDLGITGLVVDTAGVLITTPRSFLDSDVTQRSCLEICVS
jgi:hypothetical protein